MKIIKLPHKVIDYLCPINGVCDMYEWKTSKRIPDNLMFYLSNIGFAYIKQKNAFVSKMVFWGNGLGKRQYGFLENIIGFKMNTSEGTTFINALKKAKEYIDSGIPVILFGLNMYHLPYLEKYYHHIQIPGHIILMVGYSEEKQAVYIYDNSRADIQSIPYTDLMLAWGEDYPGQSRKNALFALRLNEQLPDIDEIIQNGLKKRAEAVLNPPVKNFGIPGIRKLSSEFWQWEKDMDSYTLLNAYKHFVTYTGSVVPALPERISRFNSGIADPHHGARDTFARTLIEHKDKFGTSSWDKAAALLEKSGNIIETINEILTDRIIGIKSNLENIPHLLKQVAEYEEEAFGMFLL